MQKNNKADIAFDESPLICADAEVPFEPVNDNYQIVFPKKETFSRLAIERGKFLAVTEDRLREVYARYCRTGDPGLLSTLCATAESLGSGIAFSHLRNCPGFRMSDWEDYLQDLAEQFYVFLQKDFDADEKQEDIVSTIRRFYSVHSIDIVRSLLRSAKKPPESSLEDISSAQKRKNLEGIPDPSEPGADGLIMLKEKIKNSNRILFMYIQAVLDMQSPPPNPLSVCYSRILYQIEVMFSPEEIDRLAQKRTKAHSPAGTVSPEQMIDELRRVQSSPVSSSAAWALEKMEGKAIRTLGDEAQDCLRKQYDPRLNWGSSFVAALSEKADSFGGKTWGEVIFTDHFSKKDLENRAAASHKLVLRKIVSRIDRDSTLKERILAYSLPVIPPKRDTDRR